MALVQTVHLSMANFKSAPVVPAVQNDSDRQVKMIIDDYTLTSGLTGKIAFERSDGTHYETAAELVLADNAFVADIDQALTQPGRTMVQLKVTDTLTVSTFSFVIFVEADNSGTVTPQEGIDLVTAVEAAEDAADRAESAASMFDEDVPRYVDEWLDEHPEATTTVLDGSLTEAKFSDSLKLKTIKDYVTPKMFGAKCDGITDDTSAMQSCVSYAAENNMPIVIDNESDLLISEFTLFRPVKNIIAIGRITAPNGVEFRHHSNLSGFDWYFADVNGEIIVSGLKRGFLRVLSATTLTLYADSNAQYGGSLAYNQIYLGNVTTLNLRGGESGGWINENTVYGGDIKNLNVTGYYSHNNNHFFNNCFENCTINFTVGRSNYIHNARFEGSNSVTFGVNASNNYVEQAWEGESFKREPRLPDFFHDLSGNNFFSYTGIPFIKTYELKYCNGSNNFDANRVYPTSDGKLYARSRTAIRNLYNDQTDDNIILETNLIPITHGLRITIQSDGVFFRGGVILYDENKNQITTEPTNSPFYGASLTWVTDSYGFGSADLSSISFCASKTTILGGNDSGVSYIKIRVRGYSAKVIDYFSCKIETAPYHFINPFNNLGLYSKEVPTQQSTVVYVPVDGMMVYNINPSKSCIGWFYNNNAWHQIPLST